MDVRAPVAPLVLQDVLQSGHRHMLATRWPRHALACMRADGACGMPCLWDAGGGGAGQMQFTDAGSLALQAEACACPCGAPAAVVFCVSATAGGNE